MSSAGAKACAACGSGMEPGQRYCLACGARAGVREEMLVELLRRVRRQEPRGAAGGTAGGPPGTPVPASPPASAAPVPPAVLAARPARAGAARLLAVIWGTWAAGALALPRLRVWMLLALGFLGFGVLLGHVAGSGNAVLSASSRPHLKIVVPPAAAGTSRKGGEPSAAGASAQAPETTSEATPEASSPGSGGAAATGAAGKGSGSKTAGGGETAGEGAGSGSGAGGGGGESGGNSVARKTLPAIKHVFLIVLSTEPYGSMFGPESKAAYIPSQLEKQGEVLGRYDAVSHQGLADAIALISGQGPTVATAADCPAYTPLAPATVGASEQVQGDGCIYPAGTGTLPAQLTAKHLSWRAYIEGIDAGGGTPPACAHPALGAADPTAGAVTAGPYATFRNPFVYFQSLISSPACTSEDVGLSRLGKDLKSAPATPSFAYIVPDRCHDGNPTPCTPGAAAGVATAGSFLSRVVPAITASKAYRQGGLIVVTTDEAPASGELGDSSSCCGQPSFPNLPAASGRGGLARGGGTVGALLISPFVKGGTISQEPYNHFSLLRTIEDIFKLGHLGYAAAATVKPLAPALFAAKG